LNNSVIPLLLLAVVPAPAQSPVFRSDIRVVEVAVIATANDSPVADLRAGDVRVFDNGAQQTILSFEKIGAASQTAGGTAVNDKAPGRRMPRLSIILLDGLNTSRPDQFHGRKAISEMLRNLPQGEDGIAIFTLGDNLRLLHDFSMNTTSLRTAVDGYGGELSAMGVAERKPFSGGFSLKAQASSGSGADLHTELRLAHTLAAFTEIARKMKGIPGEKNLLWVTGGFLPPEDHRDIEAAMRELTAARVTLYAIDARGLIACIGQCPPEVNLNIASMEEFAEQTGGRAFHDTNGLSDAARAAIDDSREGYILTYTPNNYRQDGSAHTVKLKTSRKGINLRYRPGYLAD
jgi:VWFA-related protein